MFFVHSSRSDWNAIRSKLLFIQQVIITNPDDAEFSWFKNFDTVNDNSILVVTTYDIHILL